MSGSTQTTTTALLAMNWLTAPNTPTYEGSRLSVDSGTKNVFLLDSTPQALSKSASPLVKSATNDVRWDLDLFTSDNGDAKRLAVVDDTSTHFTFFGLVKSTERGLSVAPANNMIEHILRVSRAIYSKAIARCQYIISSLELTDEESRLVARERMRDVLTIFSDLAENLVRDLAEEYRDDPNIIGFLLTDVLAEVDEIQSKNKTSIIASFVRNPRAGVRFEAVRALDILGGPESRKVFQAILPKEANVEIRALIDASLERSK